MQFWGAFLGAIAGIMLLGAVSAIFEAKSNNDNDQE